MDLELCFDQTANILSISLDTHSGNDRNENLIYKSQHLVVNPVQGPSLIVLQVTTVLKIRVLSKVSLSDRELLNFKVIFLHSGPNLGGPNS